MRTPAAPDRRQLLRLAAAAATAAWLPRSAWSQPRISEPPFRAGVASGSPSATSVVLWTRLLGSSLPGVPITVHWEIADDEGFTRIVQAGEAQALPELAHSVHVEAQGLAPDRWYFYRFLVGPWTSPSGRTRTFPAPDMAAQRLRLAYASCQRWEHGWFSAWRHLRADEPDAVVFLGDYIYEYPGAARPVRMPTGGWALDLEGYRARYALYKSDADLQAMHQACPWLFTWDDHEVQNDYAGEQAGNAGPVVADFAQRRAAAYQAWYEHMPVPASVLTQALQGLASGGLRIYGERRFGRLAQILLLDGRQYRSPQACNKDGQPGSSRVNPLQCPQLADPARSMLGAQQEQWLAARLASGGAAWTVLGQATLFGQRDLQPGAGTLFWNDGWDGYPAARRRLVDALRESAAPNPVILGGDVHETWVGHVKADYGRPDSANVGVEFCGTSISSRPTSAPEHLQSRWADNPHFVHADAQHRGYGLAEFTPGRLEVALRVLDDVTRRDAQIATQARFVVEAGRPLLQRA